MFPESVYKTVLNQLYCDLHISHNAISYIDKLIQHNIIQPFIDNNTDITIDSFQNFLKTKLSDTQILRHALALANKNFNPIIDKNTNKIIFKTYNIDISDDVNYFIRIVIEYLIAEILEITGSNISIAKNNFIKINRVKKTIKSDEDLKNVFVIYDF